MPNPKIVPSTPDPAEAAAYLANLQANLSTAGFPVRIVASNNPAKTDHLLYFERDPKAAVQVDALDLQVVAVQIEVTHSITKKRKVELYDVADDAQLITRIIQLIQRGLMQ